MCQGSQRTVGGGMRVAANDCHARQGCALLGSHHMHNALAHVVDGYLYNVKVAAVVVKCLHLQPRHLVANTGDTAGALLP